MRVADLLQQFAEPGTILISDADAPRRSRARRTSSAPSCAVGGAVGIPRDRSVAGRRGAAAAPRANAGALRRPPSRAALLDEPRDAGARRARPGRRASSASRAWANRGCVYELHAACGSRIMTMLEAAACPTAVWFRICRWSICCARIAAWTTAMLRGRAPRPSSAPSRRIGLPADAERVAAAPDRHRRRRAGDARRSSPEAVKARTFDALRALFLKAAARTAARHRRRGHALDRSDVGGVPGHAGRAASSAARDPAHRHVSAGLSRAVAGSLVRDADHADAARPPPTARPSDRRGRAGRTLSADVSAAILRQGGRQSVLPRGADAHGHRTRAATHGAFRTPCTASSWRASIGCPDAAKQLLQTASVLGREVPLRLLSRVWRGRRDIAPALAELCRHEFLYERAGGDEPVFVFKHALTQDVAYDSLLSRRRRDLHLEAARALEELYGDRLDEIDRDAGLSLRADRSDRRGGDVADSRGRSARRASTPMPKRSSISILPARRLRSSARRSRPRPAMLEVALQARALALLSGRWRKASMSCCRTRRGLSA